MHILHIIGAVNPAEGGPYEYLRMMVAEHEAAGHHVTLLTTDAPDAPWLEDAPAPVLACGPARPRVAAALRLRRAVQQHGDRFDVAVIHGLWHVANMAVLTPLRRAGVPWVIFTHGMLDPYFRRSNPLKSIAKQLAWTVLQGRALTGAHRVLFTCAEEERLARGSFLGHQGYRAQVIGFCADNLSQNRSALPAGRVALRRQIPALGARPYLLSLGRIHPKKACDLLIDAFADISADHPELDLVMAGPDPVGWVTELKALAARRGVAERVHWPGMVSGAAKAAAFQDATAFVLPSHQENFGIVVAESLSCGTPVVISRAVNIWREVAADRAGLICEDTRASTAQILSELLTMSPEALVDLRARARQSYGARFSVQQAAADLHHMLAEACQTATPGPAPIRGSFLGTADG